MQYYLSSRRIVLKPIEAVRNNLLEEPAMTRIFILTAILIAAFTANAFAVEDTSTVELEVLSVFTIDGGGLATFDAPVAADYDFGSIQTDGGTLTFQANTDYEVTIGFDGDFDGDVVGAPVLKGWDGAAYVTTGVVTSGSANNGDTYGEDYLLDGITWTNLPPAEYSTTVTYTIQDQS